MKKYKLAIGLVLMTALFAIQASAQSIWGDIAEYFGG
jgi:hypothetical protein